MKFISQYKSLTIVLIAGTGATFILLYIFASMLGNVTRRRHTNFTTTTNNWTIDYKLKKTIPLPVNDVTAFTISKISPLKKYYLLAGKQVISINAEGKIIKKITLTDTGSAICVSETEDIFVAMGKRLVCYNANGTEKNCYEHFGENAVLSAIAVYKEHLFCADYGQKIVWHFNLSGELISVIGRDKDEQTSGKFIIPSPYFDIALTKNNYLWVANTGRHKLEKYNFAGKLISSWGKGGTKIDCFSGCCNPTNITVDNDGNLFTSEKGLVRIKKYNAEGKMLHVVAEILSSKFGVHGYDIEVDNNETVIVLDRSENCLKYYIPNKPKTHELNNNNKKQAKKQTQNKENNNEENK